MAVTIPTNMTRQSTRRHAVTHAVIPSAVEGTPLRKLKGNFRGILRLALGMTSSFGRGHSYPDFRMCLIPRMGITTQSGRWFSS
jgi:hypothetical protein